ncbi:hypothetical protein [Nonomuraea sp. NPDC002799]
MRRPVLVLTLLLGLVLPLTPVAPAAGATGAISWTPCADNPAVECGTLTVPVDWHTPGGATR